MPANGVGAARSHAGLWGLALGSIGVVYGDIGTSPLYALREAIVAASAPEHGEIDRAAVLGVLSLILWALFVIVTLKYVVILLRADNNGEGGTLTLMALASRAVGRVSRAAGVVALLGIVSAALFYGDAVITPALSVLSAVEGVDVATPAFHEYVVPLTVVDPADSLRGPIARHGQGRGAVRPDHADLVRRHRAARPRLDRPRSGRAVGAQSVLRHRFPAPARHRRTVYARCRVPRRHRSRGALCRSRPFRPPSDPGGLDRHRAAVAGGQLSGPGRAGLCPSEGARESVLPDVSRLGADPYGRPGDGGDRDRESGRHHRRLFAHQPGDPARALAAVRSASHLGRAAPAKSICRGSTGCF